MCQRVDFFLSGTCDEPLVWNSSKRQTERQLWYHFYGAKNNLFSADRPLEHVGWLTDEIAVKGKNRDIVTSVFLNQNAINNPSDSSYFLIFELIHVFMVWCIWRFHESKFSYIIQSCQLDLRNFSLSRLIMIEVLISHRWYGHLISSLSMKVH